MGSEQSMLDQIVSGSLDFAPISSTVTASIYPDFSIYVMPFAFSNHEEFRAAQNAGAFSNLEAITSEGPVRLVSPMVISFRGLSNTKREIRHADDMKGLSFRVVAGEIYADAYNALGATTSTITFSELYTALQQGVIDGEDNPLLYVMQYKFYEQERFHTQLGMFMSVNPLIMSEKVLDKITPEQYEIIKQCAREAESYGDEEFNKIMDQAAEEYVAAGGKVVWFEDLTAEEVQSFKDATKPVWDKFAKQVAPETYKAYMEARKSVGLD